MSFLSKIKISVVRKIVSVLLIIFENNKIGKYFAGKINKSVSNRTQRVVYKEEEYTFSVPNDLNLYRVNTFSTKEPETLAWIDNIPKDSILWDIGANVGLYSIYASKTKKCKVYAFEPSFLNLELLSKNVFLNNLTDSIYILPFALTNKMGIQNFKLTSIEQGGALSTFGENYGWDGKTIPSIFNFNTFGLTMDEAINLLKIPLPDYLKIDVDGIEHLILEGGEDCLTKIKSVLIEINDDFIEQSSVTNTLLKQKGFKLQAKLHADEFNKNSLFCNTYNQIWIR